MLEYIALRREATRLYAEYLRTGDPATLERVRADNTRADALVGQLLASPKARGSESGGLGSKPSPASAPPAN